MNAQPVDPSSAAAAKEPEAKPLFSDKSVTITNHAVIISGKQYNLSEIEDVSIQKDKWQWQEAVSLCCLAAAVGFYVFPPSRGYHLPWMPQGQISPVYSIFFLPFIVFGGWASAAAASKLVFKLPTGNWIVLHGNGSWIKKIKAEVDLARIAATPTAPAGPPDNTDLPG
jgi:hypothetical protein